MKTLNNNTANRVKTVAAALVILASFAGIATGANSSKERINLEERKATLAAESLMGTRDNLCNTETTEEMNTPLNIESWMNSSNYWSGNETGNDIISEKMQAEKDLSLQIESWMNSSAYWEGADNSIETASELPIENWMTSNTYWNGNSTNEAKELANEIKSWMDSSAYWEVSEEQSNTNNNLADR